MNEFQTQKNYNSMIRCHLKEKNSGYIALWDRTIIATQKHFLVSNSLKSVYLFEIFTVTYE